MKFCAGPGGRTHYFDETAPQVGEAIDQLIAIATIGKSAYPHDCPVLG